MELDGGYECSCSSGYELRDDGFTCEGIAEVLQNSMIIICYADIDECAQGTAGCSQECKNTNGSFICNCHEGYQTYHVDPTFCVGMLYS